MSTARIVLCVLLMTGCNLDAEEGPARADREADRPVTVASPSDPALIPGEEGGSRVPGPMTRSSTPTTSRTRRRTSR